MDTSAPIASADITDASDNARLHQAFIGLRDGLSETIVGQADLVERLLIALLADGHLLVEGAPGLAKVPFLGDIPFLGNLFKKKGRAKDKAELLIFITPKVLAVAKR